MQTIKKVFIAGGTGFLGYHAALKFLDLGIQVDTIALENEIEISNWFDSRIHLSYGNLFTMNESEIYNLLKDKNYDCFIYALGPDDRYIPKAPAYDFFYDRLVRQCKKICQAAKKANIQRCVILGSYFATYDKKMNGKLSQYHPYIKARIQQEQELIALGKDSLFSVMILELPYIFGTMPQRKPLWRDSFLKYYDKMKSVILPKNGGTAVIDVWGVAESIVACSFFGKHGTCYPIGKENLPFKVLIPLMLKSSKDNRKYKEIPAFLTAIGAKFIDRKFKKQGLESGLNHAKLMTQIQCKKFYIDGNQTMEALNFKHFNFYGGKDIYQSIEETMKACYPERF